jgi:hypothetical protein
MKIGNVMSGHQQPGAAKIHSREFICMVLYKKGALVHDQRPGYEGIGIPTTHTP